MNDEDTDRFGELFPSSRSGVVSKPKETLSLPLWKDVDLVFKDVFGVSEERRDEAIHRYNVLELLIERYGTDFSIKEIDDGLPTLKEKFGSNTPSASSIYRYWKAFKKSDYQLSSLIPKVTAGNTGNNVAEELEPLIQEAIKDYFSAEEQTAASAYITLETEVSRYNEIHGTQYSLFSIQSFRNRLRKHSEYEKVLLRKGKSAADSIFRKVGQRPATTRVLERVEADHTRLDLFVIDERHGIPLGRPWLTLLYDTHTKSIIGFYLGFEPPSYLSVSLALENAILPKDYVKELYPSVEGVWPCYGLPEHLIVDNGAEFNSSDFKIACKELKVKVKKNPTKKPWLKGSVERYFRTINNRLLSRIPGKSFTNIFERKDYDPLENAVIDSLLLQEMIHIWIVDIYQNGKNGLENNIPNLRWLEAVNSSIPPRPFNGTREQLKFNLGKNHQVALDKNGVRLGTTIRYSSTRLARYFGGHTCSSRKSVKVRIKYDPSCLGRIYVLDEVEEEFFAVEAVDADYAYSVSEWLHKTCCNYARRHIRKNYNHADVVKAWRKILCIIDDAIEKTGRSKKRNSLGITTTSRVQRVKEHSERATSETKQHQANINANSELDDDLDWDLEVNTRGWSIE
ncbi:Mu transposase C-terminal domain-containing protein [Vibrio parahaemolyticus]|uniref:Mu transposase C-terminal domain-containing protein n=1 Tax=Vibrio parahaemolyticus TaxID=670 RepID=UPI00186A5BD3|nr:Mu transposase C-terminal domain-containing protein [Vibrio parahaemolyticus]MBE4319180.1 transposase [Vibrio parahaemolyticus]MBE4337328.1 transposase [Vibrio parahaemolyticus]MEA5180530.1 Mu transposase C-terminal domain-containing protein [Vibrio parahaemolyticus]HAS6906907.1 DDE-type integrase/transposase/recombinase [Vibrio parahaemolyticus]HAV1350147.1 transposase [Vibrio parahaemolyticus]